MPLPCHLYQHLQAADQASNVYLFVTGNMQLRRERDACCALAE